MADVYALEFVGGPDGTLNPPKKLDGRVVGAKERRIRATKPQIILNVGDRLYLGKYPQGAVTRAISACFDTSLGTTTLSIGTTANPTKYVNAKTVTAVDIPTGIGPRAAAIITDPLIADEDLWLTVGVAAIPSAVIGAFELVYTQAN